MADIKVRDFRVLPNDSGFNLLDVPTTWDRRAYKSEKGYEKKLKEEKEKMAELQALFYAGKRRGILFAIQAMDAAGKDGLICHVMTGLNPQGCQVTSFKRPTEAELKQHYLERHTAALPQPGMIGIWNRSHYEEVGVVRVNPEILKARNIDPSTAGRKFWDARLQEIKEWEEQAHKSGTTIVKLFLHVSKHEQAKRLLERAEDPSKHWKFNPGDLVERKKMARIYKRHSYSRLKCLSRKKRRTSWL